MNIGFIGAGTASAIAIMTAIKTMQTLNVDFNDVTITCISDPNKPTAQVGESTSGLVYDTMREVLGLDFLEDIDVYDGTLRYYTNYFWEQANGNNFTVSYHSPGFHLNSDKWSSYILNKLTERYSYFLDVQDEIIEINQLNGAVVVKGAKDSYFFNYLIDCRGSPSKEELAGDEYDTTVFESVNSVILFPDFKNYMEYNTSAYVHDNGWMFGVPLQHRKAFGYLYNNKITTYDDAVIAFSKLKNIDASKLRNFSWQPYKKKLALDRRVLSLGNRLYLFEPQQAIPLHYYAMLAETFIEGVANNIREDELADNINDFNNIFLENIQNLMALSYVGKNKIDSPFWTHMQKKSKDKLLNSANWQEWLTRVQEENQILGYAPVDSSMMRSYLKGFNIDLNSLKNEGTI